MKSARQNLRQKASRTIQFLDAAALNHPNICQIYDIAPDYLVLEYIDGKPW